MVIKFKTNKNEKTTIIESWLKRAVSLVSISSYINVKVDDRIKSIQDSRSSNR